MARLISVALGAVLFLFVGQPAAAQQRGTAGARMAMARAMCTTGPCAPQYNFRSGFAQFKRLRQPRLVGRRDIGTVRLDRVWTSGPPLPTALSGTLTGRINYATFDPDANCPLVGSDSTQEIATSSLFCQQSGPTWTSCRGRIILNSDVMNDPNCTDVQVFLSGLTVEIYEAGGVGDDSKMIARNGALVIGRTPDCNSGGAGCP